MGDFYTTMAEVLPLLLLALIWDSSYLDRLRGQRRLSRRVDPAGVRFWTKPRVRVYTLMIAGIVIVSTGISILVLGRFIPDSLALRVTLSCGLVVVLSTLLTRIYFDVIVATSTAAEKTARIDPLHASADDAAVTGPSRPSGDGAPDEPVAKP